MILNFQPRDLNTFEARFGQHMLEIHKQADNSWRLFVNGNPVKDGAKDTSRKCMEMAERVAQKVINRSMEDIWHQQQ